MNLSANDLIFLLELTRASSISATAKKLGIDQSTISRQLQSLEAKIGKDLFSRHRSGLEPTKFVKDLLATAEKIELLVLGVRQFDIIKESVPRGEVHISCPSSIADRMLARHLPDFLEKHPKIRIRLSTTNKEFDLNKLECDIAILVNKPWKGNSVNLRLTRSPLKFFGHKMFASASVKSHNSDLLFLCMPGDVQLIEKWAPQISSSQIRMVSNRLASILVAAERGAGVVLIPEVFGRYLESLDLIEIEVKGWPSLPVELYLAAPKAVRRLPHVDAVWNWVRQLFRT